MSNLLQKYLVNNGPKITSSRLRRLLIDNQIKDDKCENCGIINWLDRPISFHLDHINGNRRDNRLYNLRVLCPNCHSQTETYGRMKPDTIEQIRSSTLARRSKCNCGKILELRNKTGLCAICLNKQRSIKRSTIESKKRVQLNSFCENCGVKIRSSQSKICRKCFDANRQTKIDWPKDLVEQVKATSLRQVARILGVSDKAVAKRIKNHHDLLDL